MNTVASQAEFDVGGVRLPRPFRIRRLGHFGVNVRDPEASLDFLLPAARFSRLRPDRLRRALPAAEQGRHGPGIGYFTRHGTDHHSFVLFPRGVLAALNPHYRAHPELVVNQITWQVGSLREVTGGFRLVHAARAARAALRAANLPGSNWPFLSATRTATSNELYYGIEQVGWDGYSKPRAMHKTRYEKPPALPHRSEYAEVNQAFAEGYAAASGWRAEEKGEEKFDVGGVLLARRSRS